MFEALAAYQPELTDFFRAQIIGREFAQANLFSGPSYSLRMSFALECVRILDCQQEGEALCRCPSCRSNRLLAQENLLIVSKRDHRHLVQSALSSYERLGTDYTKTEAIRALRTLLLAHHPQLSTLAEAAALNDAVGQFAQSGEQDERERKRWVKELGDGTRRLLGAMKKNVTITVSQVRSIAEWVGRSAIGSDKRFIIIEAMEETGLSARNALLKILEEPPAGVYFFLLSEHPGRIMQTILSRVRHTRFSPLSKEALAQYLQPYYPAKEYDSLERFILESGGLDVQKIEDQANRLAATVVSGKALSTTELSELFGALDGAEGFGHLLAFMLSSFEQAVKAGTLSIGRAEKMIGLASRRFQQGQMYSQDIQMMGQGLYYSLLEVR